MLIRFILLLTAALLTSTLVPAQTSSASALEATVKKAHWRQRVLLICAPSAADASLLAQRNLLESAAAGLRERDLLVRELVLPELPAPDRAYLRRLGVKTDAFQVLLLGKDGGLKRRDTQPVAPQTLFSTIDAMPMRRQEMKRAE
ncbi:DUF4174 domain-containing protein [Hymenobacter sp. NST-14]|uniref:DUF4174 domain-containing protein n=1 Tax=Hymenobacter piscis TaxID=2839984 RepID=UPI001C00E111|nr:DUF4174 domain-containing protein [Hymenobacter piscis]MBT9391673.1 DUF4174 domain-containing protein [Hymenobacter piscis]